MENLKNTTKFPQRSSVKNHFRAQIAAAITIFTIMVTSCIGGSNNGETKSGSGLGSLFSIKEEPKLVRAYDPNMYGMEMLSMEQQPGWTILAGTDWIGTSNYTNCIKGVNEKMNAMFYFEGGRSYIQTQLNQSGTTDGKSVYLNYLSATDYLDYVFHRQFPNLNNAKRTKLKTVDQFSEEERNQMEESRIRNYNNMLQSISQLANAHMFKIQGQYIDRSMAEYKWVDEKGDSIVHSMSVTIHATVEDIVNPYAGTTRMIIWSQESIYTSTGPVKNAEKLSKDMEKMLSTAKYNPQYIAACNNIVQQEMERKRYHTQRVMSQMAVAEMRHQQKLADMNRETQEYVSNVRREVFANREASRERVSQGWRDAIVGVDRFVGTDGNIVEVPVSAGHNVWQSADGGTIYSSDSYLFNPITTLPDKDGIDREFRQLQLLK
jgi:hypothetical protein